MAEYEKFIKKLTEVAKQLNENVQEINECLTTAVKIIKGGEE